MKKSVLLIIGVLAISAFGVEYGLLWRSHLIDVRVKMLSDLTMAFDNYARVHPGEQIDPLMFRTMVVSILNLPSGNPSEDVTIDCNQQLIHPGSNDIICILGYRGKVYVGICGDRRRIILSKEQRNSWAQDNLPVRGRAVNLEMGR